MDNAGRTRVKKDIDWGALGFGYIKTDSRYVSLWRDGVWDDGTMVADADLTISESAGVLQYAQTVFEGLKAFTAANGDIVCFRPDLNAERMADSCERLVMPVFPRERFLDAVDRVVRANAAYVPPFGTGASLYLRPFMFGSGAVIGVSPAPEYTFRLFATPVGAYFKGGVTGVRLVVSDYDRAAPNGTGHIKAGLNYAMSLYPGYAAKARGFGENLYTDAATHTKIEETGGANFIFVTGDKQIVTPKSPSILPSITRRSLMAIARDHLGYEVIEREVLLSELADFAECGLCGTAAVISPVSSVTGGDKEICFTEGMGPVTKTLYDTLIGMQTGLIPAPGGWIRKIL